MRMGAGVVAWLLAAVTAVALAEGVVPDATWSGPFGIEVRVEDHRGRDLEGAELTLVWLDGVRGGPPPARSGADGRVRFAGLAPGRWELVARREGQMTYVAEIVVTAERPQVVTARHENVRGAISPMRLRVTRGPMQLAAVAPVAAPRAATPTPSDRRRVEESVPVRPASPPTPAPPAVTPAPAPVAEVSPPPAAPPEAGPAVVAPLSPAAAVTPAPTAVPPPMTAPAPTPSAPAAPAAATPSPSRPNTPPSTPASAPTTPVAARPAATPEPTPVPEEAPIAASDAPAPIPAPAPVADRRTVEPPLLRRHADRTCPECPAGEASLSIDVMVNPSSTAPGCPAEAVSAFAGLPVGEWEGGVAALPPACAALLLDLPERARFTGYRYEAAAEGRYEDCPAGRDCPGLSCSWAGDPLVVKDGGTTRLAALFGNRAERPRRARFTAYFKEARR